MRMNASTDFTSSARLGLAELVAGGVAEHDDRDHPSKVAFGLVLQLSRLDFKRQHLGGPLLTLPTGR